jgi:hypothetical protein
LTPNELHRAATGSEAGKGDHRHFGGKEGAYTFQTPEKLIADFERDIARWNRENRNA